MAFIQSFGAAKVVTGSAHLLTLKDGKKILIDCGMFQGENEEKNSQPLDFDPHEVDWLIFTHTHLDHVGRSPLLFKEGFRGLIEWMEHFEKLDNVFLIHGEEEKQIVFRQAIMQKLGKKAHIIEESEEIYI